MFQYLFLLIVQYLLGVTMKIFVEHSSSQVLEVDSIEEDENISYSTVLEKSFGFSKKCLNSKYTTGSKNSPVSNLCKRM